MKLKNEFNPVRNWAEDRGIYAKGDVKTQYIKFQEECGELAKAIINNDDDEFIDAIGDCVIALTSVAKFKGLNIEDCINSAYAIIEKRTGQMKNGSFIKNQD
jgi:NTP pyrophosphatase (non-canonical NTP hydrolase)